MLILLFGFLSYLTIFFALPILVLFVFPIINFLDIRMYSKSNTTLQKKFWTQCLIVSYVLLLIISSLFLIGMSFDGWHTLVNIGIIKLNLTSYEKSFLKLAGWLFFIYALVKFFNLLIDCLYKNNMELHQAVRILLNKQKKQIWVIILLVCILNIFSIIYDFYYC